MKKAAVIPYDFVLEQLYQADPVVRPMFGGYAIYVKDKIVMMLRKKDAFQHDNGVWVATSREHHESLRKEFPSMRTIRIFGVKESGWQNLPEEASDFEEEVSGACRLILKGDLRIGKVPKPKKKAGAAKKRAVATKKSVPPKKKIVKKAGKKKKAITPKKAPPKRKKA